MMPSGAGMDRRTLKFIPVGDWPKLSWVAVIRRIGEAITVLHGPCVETHDSWFVEAVWDGEFTEGDFDRTALVIGTGGRLRGDAMCFVTSGDTLDCLYWHQDSGGIVVANSLPALLTVAEVGLAYKELWQVDAIFRATKSLLETRPIFHRRDETIRGHVFCSFLALLLRKALQDRLAAAGQAFEWADILQDLEALEEVEVSHCDKRFRLRTQAKGSCGAVFQAVGVALPPTVRQLEAPA